MEAAGQTEKSFSTAAFSFGIADIFTGSAALGSEVQEEPFFLTEKTIDFPA